MCDVDLQSFDCVRRRWFDGARIVIGLLIIGWRHAAFANRPSARIPALAVVIQYRRIIVHTKHGVLWDGREKGRMELASCGVHHLYALQVFRAEKSATLQFRSPKDSANFKFKFVTGSSPLTE
jgi:hypothetical protein